eukprot:COSAG01_NODE_51678_length_352_cov_108.739130_2_plen_24_part_01
MLWRAWDWWCIAARGQQMKRALFG